VPTLLDLLAIDSEAPFEGHSLLPQVESQRVPEIRPQAKDIIEPSVDIPFKDEEIERLRSLGYVE
jgi:hypothetical protein